MSGEDRTADTHIWVIMYMLSHNGWKGKEPAQFHVMMPMPPGDYDHDEGPFYDLVYWLENHLGRPDSSYQTHSYPQFDYIIRNEYFAVWAPSVKRIGFGFVSDHLATIFKTFHT